MTSMCSEITIFIELCVSSNVRIKKMKAEGNSIIRLIVIYA